MSRVQAWLQQSLTQLDPWLDAVFPIATALICARERLAGYSLLTLYLLLRLLQRSEREPWRWILISLLVVNAGLIIEDRDIKPGSPSDYLIVALSFAAGFQRTQQEWRTSLAWMASCIIPLLGFSVAAGEGMIQGTSSFTGFNINRIGFLSGLLTIYAYGLLITAKKPKPRAASTLLIAAGLTESLLTQSRAAIAVPIIAIGLDIITLIPWTPKRVTAACLTTLTPILIALHSWYGTGPGIDARNADLNRIATIQCWIRTTAKSADQLILGLGYGKTAKKYCGPQQIKALKDRDTPLSHSHNVFVQLFSETGAIGLMFGAGLTYTGLRTAWTSSRMSQHVTTRALLIYLLVMAMGTTWHTMLLNQVLVGFSLATLTAKESDPSTEAGAIL
jgi:hypothetical protein